MKTLKKTLCLVLAVVMVVGVLILPAYAAEPDYSAAITNLQNYGILQGYPDGKLHEDANITRGQMAAIIYRIMTGDVKSTDAEVTVKFGNYANIYSDANVAPWAKGYIGYCTNQGVLKGYDTGKVEANKQISGYEVRAMLLRALGYDKNNEYTGANWKFNVLSDADKTGISKNVTTLDPASKTPRGAVAQFTYDAAFMANRVEPSLYPTVGYASLGVSLVNNVSSSTSMDKWGAPEVTYTCTFTYPDIDVPGSNKVTVEPLYKFYGPMTQCDVYDETEVEGKDLPTYTNGKGNVGTQTISATNTDSLIGAQGRETRVYADRIVYRDIVLAVSKGDTNSGKLDSAGHPVTEDGTTTTVTVYANEGMEGVGALAAGAKKVLATAAVDGTNYKVKGAYKKDAVLMGYVLTDVATTKNTVVGATSAPDNPRFEAIGEVTPVNITVDAIAYDNSGTNQAVGFVGTDGVKYLYNISYSYNKVNFNKTTPTPEISSDTDDAPINDAALNTLVLNDTCIGKTYSVYLDSNKNVIGIVPSTTAAAAKFGVVTSEKSVSVETAIGVTEKNYIESTLLMSDGSTKTYKTVSASDKLYKDTEIQTASTSSLGKLVMVSESTLTGYYKLSAANSIGTVTETATGSGKLYAGNAQMFGTANPMVNSKTVFFVENYSLNNSLGSDVYEPTNYSIYTDFRTLTQDYGATGDIKRGTAASSHEGFTVTGFKSDAGDSATGATDTVKYVLIKGATQKTTMAERKQPVPNYAFVLYNQAQKDVYKDYYQFNVLINGAKSTLKLNSTSGKTVTASGLYIYKPDGSTNGLSVFAPTTAVNAVADINSANISCTDGVLKLDVAIEHLNGETSAAPHESWNKQNITVAKDVKIYIVNKSNGNATLTDYSLSDVIKLYGGDQATPKTADLHLVLNEYGWVTTVYVDDINLGSDPDPMPTSYGKPTIEALGARGVKASWTNNTGANVGEVQLYIEYRTIGTNDWAFWHKNTAATVNSSTSAELSTTMPENIAGWQVRAVLYIDGDVISYSDPVVVY